jgi:hypothetical protein
MGRVGAHMGGVMGELTREGREGEGEGAQLGGCHGGRCRRKEKRRERKEKKEGTKEKEKKGKIFRKIKDNL